MFYLIKCNQYALLYITVLFTREHIHSPEKEKKAPSNGEWSPHIPFPLSLLPFKILGMPKISSCQSRTQTTQAAHAG